MSTTPRSSWPAASNGAHAVFRVTDDTADAITAAASGAAAGDASRAGRAEGNEPRDFIAAHRDRSIATEDFKAAVEKHMLPMNLDGDGTMNWFFDQTIEQQVLLGQVPVKRALLNHDYDVLALEQK